MPDNFFEKAAKAVNQPKQPIAKASAAAPAKTAAGASAPSKPVKVSSLSPSVKAAAAIKNSKTDHATAFKALAPLVEPQYQGLLNSALYINQRNKEGRHITPIEAKDPAQFKVSVQDAEAVRQKMKTPEGRQELAGMVRKFQNERQILSLNTQMARKSPGFAPKSEVNPAATPQEIQDRLNSERAIIQKGIGLGPGSPATQGIQAGVQAMNAFNPIALSAMALGQGKFIDPVNKGIAGMVADVPGQLFTTPMQAVADTFTLGTPGGGTPLEKGGAALNLALLGIDMPGGQLAVEALKRRAAQSALKVFESQAMKQAEKAAVRSAIPEIAQAVEAPVRPIMSQGPGLTVRTDSPDFLTRQASKAASQASEIARLEAARTARMAPAPVVPEVPVAPVVESPKVKAPDKSPNYYARMKPSESTLKPGVGPVKGFTITGKSPKGQMLNIFEEDAATAAKMRDNIKAGRDPHEGTKWQHLSSTAPQPSPKEGLKRETIQTRNGAKVDLEYTDGKLKIPTEKGAIETDAKFFDYEGIPVAVHRTVGDYKGPRVWSMSTAKTGHLIATGESEAGAVLYGKQAINDHGIENVKKLIDSYDPKTDTFKSTPAAQAARVPKTTPEPLMDGQSVRGIVQGMQQPQSTARRMQKPPEPFLEPAPQVKPQSGPQRQMIVNRQQVNVTPEMEAEIARHNLRMENLKRTAARQADIASEGYRHAAEMRKLSGALTEVEQRNAAWDAKKIRGGDRVAMPGQGEGTVVSNPAFGKVKVKFDNGLEASIPHSELKKVPPVIAKPVEPPSHQPPVKAAKVETVKTESGAARSSKQAFKELESIPESIQKEGYSIQRIDRPASFIDKLDPTSKPEKVWAIIDPQGNPLRDMYYKNKASAEIALPRYTNTSNPEYIAKNKEAFELLRKETELQKTTAKPQSIESGSDLFIREASPLETGSQAFKSRAFAAIPDKEGFKKVYKPYGEHGRGFYYVKDEAAVVTSPSKPAPKVETPAPVGMAEARGPKVVEPAPTGRDSYSRNVDRIPPQFRIRQSYKGGVIEHTREMSPGVWEIDTRMSDGSTVTHSGISSPQPPVKAAKVESPKVDAPATETFRLVNMESLSRGTGAKYIVGIRGGNGDLIAKRWARSADAKLAQGEVIVDFNGKTILNDANVPVVAVKTAPAPTKPPTPTQSAPKPTEPVRAPQVKEAWQMSREEFVRNADPSTHKQMWQFQDRSITDAVFEGKPVPDSIKRLVPDLEERIAKRKALMEQPVVKPADTDASIKQKAAEYKASREALSKPIYEYTKEEYAPTGSKGVATLRIRHNNAVIRALQEGKVVPVEVLADYPSLKQASPQPPVKAPKVETPAPVVEKGGKQPWEMTREEFSKHPNAKYHGGAAAIDEFRLHDRVRTTGGGLGSHTIAFSNPEVAGRYVKDFHPGGAISPAIVNSKKVAKLDPGKFHKLQDLVYDIDKGKTLTETQDVSLEIILKELGVDYSENLYKSTHPITLIKKSGYDAITTPGSIRGAEPEYLVLDPSTIKTHKQFISQALKEGKPVPAEVLADYPDLAAKYGKGAPKPVGKATNASAIYDLPEEELRKRYDYTKFETFKQGQVVKNALNDLLEARQPKSQLHDLQEQIADFLQLRAGEISQAEFDARNLKRNPDYQPVTPGAFKTAFGPQETAKAKPVETPKAGIAPEPTNPEVAQFHEAANRPPTENVGNRLLDEIGGFSWKTETIKKGSKNIRYEVLIDNESGVELSRGGTRQNAISGALGKIFGVGKIPSYATKADLKAAVSVAKTRLESARARYIELVEGKTGGTKVPPTPQPSPKPVQVPKEAIAPEPPTPTQSAPKPTEPVRAPQVKEPWQMTREEWGPTVQTAIKYDNGYPIKGGQPREVYHGSRAPISFESRPAFVTTDKSFANVYAGDIAGVIKGGKPHLYEGFATVKTPVKITFPTSGEGTKRQFFDNLASQGIIIKSPKGPSKGFSHEFINSNLDQIVNQSKAAGYDSVQFRDRTLGAHGQSILVFDAKSQLSSHNQIVGQALKEGKPVPAEVLADYPDLAAKYGKGAPKPVETPKAGIAPEPVKPPKSGMVELNGEQFPGILSDERKAAMQAEYGSLLPRYKELEAKLKLKDGNYKKAATPELIAEFEQLQKRLQGLKATADMHMRSSRKLEKIKFELEKFKSLGEDVKHGDTVYVKTAFKDGYSKGRLVGAGDTNFEVSVDGGTYIYGKNEVFVNPPKSPSPKPSNLEKNLARIQELEAKPKKNIKGKQAGMANITPDDIELAARKALHAVYTAGEHLHTQIIKIGKELGLSPKQRAKALEMARGFDPELGKFHFEPKPKQVKTPKNLPVGEKTLKHADTAPVRESLGMPEYTKTAETIDDTFRVARERGLVKDARKIAASVIENPKRPVNKYEQAALIARADELDVLSAQKYEQLGNTPEGKRQSVLDQIAAIEDEYSTIIKASDLTGSAQGSALRLRREASKELTSANIKGHIIKANGGTLPHELEARIGALSEKLAKANQAVRNAKKAVGRGDAQAALNTAAKAEKSGKKAARGTRNRLFTKEAFEEVMARRGKGSSIPKSKQRGAAMIDAQDWKDLGTIVGYHIESGIRDFPQLMSKSKEVFPDVDDFEVSKAVEDYYSLKKLTPEAKAKAKAASAATKALKADAAAASAAGIPDLNKFLDVKISAGKRDYNQLKEAAKKAGFTDLNDQEFSKSIIDVLRERGHEFETAAEAAARRQKYSVVSEARALIEKTRVKAAYEETKGLKRAGYVTGQFIMSAPGQFKNLRASFDLSAAGRQGLLLSIAHPKKGAQALKSMLESVTKQGYEKVIADVHASKYFEAGQIGGLGIADTKGHMTTDELFTHLPFETKFGESPLGQGIKKYGGAIPRMSEQTYNAYLSHLRQNVFDSIAAGYEAQGGKLTKANAEQIAQYVNSMSGLAKSKNQALEGGLKFLNWFLFSSRFLTSRAQVGSGYTLGRALVHGGPLAKQAAKDHAIIIGGLSTILGLTTLAGGKVSANPDNPDFLQVQFGNQRVDITGGVAPVLRAMIRGTMGIVKPSVAYATGQPYTPPGYGQDAGTHLGRFFINRTSPLIRAGVNSYQGESFGRPTDPSIEARNLLMPIGAEQAINSATVDKRSISDTFTLAILEFFGLSTQFTDKSPGELERKAEQKAEKAAKKAAEKEEKKSTPTAIDTAYLLGK